MPDDADPFSDLLPEPVAATLPGLVPVVPGAAGRPERAPLVAVTGVTGYVGGRLVPELLAAGYRVRAVARHPDRLRGRPWFADVETAVADASEAAQIRAALDGVDIAYYLIHSLGTGHTFEARDRHTALVFAQAAREAGVRRINRFIEERVRARPAEWFWVHKRWPTEIYKKDRPSG